MMARDPRAPAVNLIGAPVKPALTGPGVTVIRTEESTMPKAERDGVYTFPGKKARYGIRKGDPLPEGAELVPEASEQRAQKAAPENKAKQAAPETKAKGH